MALNDNPSSLVRFRDTEHRESVYSTIKSRTQNPSGDPLEREALLHLATHLGWVSGESPDSTVVELSFKSDEHRDMCVRSLESTDDDGLNWLAKEI